MPRKIKKPKEILENVLIEQIAAEGNSLAHVDGKVLFVPQVIPGDVVDVQLTRKRTGYMEGYALRIVTPSPDRIEPFCEHYGSCGGCKWEPLPYPLQIQYKQQQVLDQLSRIGHLELPPMAEAHPTSSDPAKCAVSGSTPSGVYPILGSEHTTEYRNKLEFTFSDRRWLFPGEKPEDIFDPPTPLDPKDFKDGVFPHHLRGGFSSVNSRPSGFGLGFHIVGCFDKVLDIRHCHLQCEPSNAIRNFIRDYAIEHKLSFFNLREQRGFLRNLVVRNNIKGDFMLTVVFGPDADPLGQLQGYGAGRQEDLHNYLALNKPVQKMDNLLDAIHQRFPEIKSLNYVINGKRNDIITDLAILNYCGDDAIYEEMEGLRFKIGPKSFYQTNSLQAYRLYSVVREFADFHGGERVYDLYTGTGTIALFISRMVQSVVGIEYVPEAIEDARVNAHVNGITNCDFYAGDMNDILTSNFIESHGGAPDVIILDPPRAGIHPDVAKVILEAKPVKIVYVSCNPATQARDLAMMSADYEITAVRSVDMFPHTHHVENVVALKRR